MKDAFWLPNYSFTLTTIKYYMNMYSWEKETICRSKEMNITYENIITEHEVHLNRKSNQQLKHFYIIVNINFARKAYTNNSHEDTASNI